MVGEVFSLTSLGPFTAPVTSSTLGGSPRDTTAYRHGMLAMRNPVGSGKRIVPISAIVHGSRASNGAAAEGWASAVLRHTAGTGSYLTAASGAEVTYATAAPGAAAEAYVATGAMGGNPEVATPEAPPLYVRAGSLSRLLAAGQVRGRGSNLGGEAVLDFRDVCSASGLYLAESEILVVRVSPDGTSYSITFTWAEVTA